MQRKSESVVGTSNLAQMRLQIYPRRKAGQKKRDSGTGAAVVVTLEVLQSFADIPLVHAAKKLGISKTALKSACRTLGLERWPFRRPLDSQPTPNLPKTKGEVTGKKRKAEKGEVIPARAGGSRKSGSGRTKQQKIGPVRKTLLRKSGAPAPVHCKCPRRGR